MDLLVDMFAHFSSFSTRINLFLSAAAALVKQDVTHGPSFDAFNKPLVLSLHRRPDAVEQ